MKMKSIIGVVFFLVVTSMSFAGQGIADIVKNHFPQAKMMFQGSSYVENQNTNQYMFELASTTMITKDDLQGLANDIMKFEGISKKIEPNFVNEMNVFYEHDNFLLAIGVAPDAKTKSLIISISK